MRKKILFTTIIYFLIIISGESIGGPLLIYFIFGLLIPTTSSLCMFVGIILYLFSIYNFRSPTIKIFIPIGTALLYAGYIIFFLTDKKHYNYGSFYQSIPLGSLLLFIAASLYLNIQVLYKKSSWVINNTPISYGLYN